MTSGSEPPKKVMFDTKTSWEPAVPFDIPPLDPSRKLVAWISYGQGGMGDFYNSLAIALNLNPGHIRIISDKLRFDQMDDADKQAYGFSTAPVFEFIDPETRIRYYEQAADSNIPHVIIHGTSSRLFKYYKDHAIDELKKAVTVMVAMPDFWGAMDTAKLADISVRFSHQLEMKEVLTENALLVDLAPSRITPNIIAAAASHMPEEFAVFKDTAAKPVYTIILGETIEHGTEGASCKDAKNLAEKIAAIIKNTGGSVLVCTSPRTHPASADMLDNSLKHLLPENTAYKFYNFNHNLGSSNVYKAFLGLADVVIVTDDSMSMTADLVASGKPVYIAERTVTSEYATRHSVHKEHGELVKNKGYARSIEELPNHSENTQTITHNSAYEIAAAIKAKLKLREMESARGDFTETVMNGKPGSTGMRR